MSAHGVQRSKHSFRFGKRSGSQRRRDVGVEEKLYKQEKEPSRVTETNRFLPG